MFPSNPIHFSSVSFNLNTAVDLSQPHPSLVSLSSRRCHRSLSSIFYTFHTTTTCNQVCNALQHSFSQHFRFQFEYYLEAKILDTTRAQVWLNSVDCKNSKVKLLHQLVCRLFADRQWLIDWTTHVTQVCESGRLLG